MNPFGSRASDDFARLLDSGGTVALVTRLRATGSALDGAVAPRPEFRAALRTRLLAVATVQATVQAAAPAPAAARSVPLAVSWRRRAGAVAAGAMASVVAVSGVAVAGSQSLPGDPFYGVKRTTEAFQLRMADGDLEKGTRHLDFAATRLREVRGLTLGRDAADAGPVLGPAAMSGGLVLRSAEQPLATGAALSAGVADRVRSTLAEMDEETREGSELLTKAFRSSQAPEPLRALSRFATRQSAGLEQLLPALPPATQTRARASLALLSDVEETTDELIRIGTCGTGCDPSTAAPTLPSVPGAPAPTTTGQDCACPEPAPGPTTEPAPTTEPQPAPTPEPQPTSGSAAPSSPAPAPSPTPSSDPLPVPLPTPSLPIPLPTLSPLPEITLAPLAPVLESVLPGITGNSSSDPAPAPQPTPIPQLAPAPPRY